MAQAQAQAQGLSDVDTQSSENRSVTILISIDGFRPDYLDRSITPVLNNLVDAGATARMRPSFPTKTFPNHYTLVTGKRPDHHGIVGNSMIDPARPSVKFSLGDARQALDPFWWGQAEPIWVTAEKQGIRTATMFWPGSEIEYGKIRPTDWLRFDQNIDNAQRVRTVVDWMRRPAAIRPKLVTLYFDTVDTAGHRFGPDSDEVNYEIAKVDGEIGNLVMMLQSMNIQANLVIVADHGMMATSDERVIQLNDILPKEQYIAVETGPYAAIEPEAGTDNLVYDALIKAGGQRPHEHMQCVRKENLPERLHYGSNARVAAIICLADAGWTILSGPSPYPVKGGAHGYDNDVAEMDALFIAAGVGIKRQEKPLERFDNVEIYGLIAALAGITPLPSDGDDEIAKKIVK
ncbi:alkaline phosphatase family protein [Sphingorhabdus lutea]|uniref:Alkaline phosphatase family protein n=1 Tax=Sphingorhabdus lutea TaxID=1913578 RepID=A0A1L3JE74_9SPHN|nr:alkaline phosphatase family protein [Sphingorhabdus lutea]